MGTNAVSTHRLSFILLLSIVFLISGVVSYRAATAATYYVSTQGSDAYAGTMAQPFLTLSKGISVLQAGDTLYIKAGTYTESIDSNTMTIPAGTSWSNAVTIAAYPGDIVTLRPAAGMQVLNLSTSNLQYLIFEGLIIDAINVQIGISGQGGVSHIRFKTGEVKNASSNGIVLLDINGLSADFFEFQNIAIYNNGKDGLGHGLYISTSNNIIEHCEIYNNLGYGVYVHKTDFVKNLKNNIIRNNRIKDNMLRRNDNTGGIFIASGEDNIAYNNVVIRNFEGIRIGDSTSNTKIYYNTVYANRNVGIAIAPGSDGAIIQNNIVYGNGDTIVPSGVGTISSNNLIRNPFFIDDAADDFSLPSGSPAINYGFRVPEVMTDFDGYPRSQGTADDVGAHTYRPDPGLHWNSWLQDQQPNPIRLESLEADDIRTYTFVLDLSPINYHPRNIRMPSSVPIDPTLKGEIQKLIAKGQSEITLLFRPMLIGTGLHLISSVDEVNKPRDFNFERLKDPKPDDSDLMALQAGTVSLEAFSEKIRAGFFRVKLMATKPGCKAIAVSIWNASGTVPLDHLVHEFSVRMPGEKPPYCGIATNPLRGGLETLLTSMISGDMNRRIEADASLHIFETRTYGGRLQSHAVYMQRQASQTGKQPPDGRSVAPLHRAPPLFVKHWTLPEPMSLFLANPEKLEKHVMIAREKAQHSLPPENQPVWAYDGVAQALNNAIFNSEGDATNAIDARNKLDELTKAHEHRVILMTRLVSADNQSLFLPLGLLSARGRDQVLSRPVTVVQQMTSQRVSRGEPCIGSWAFAIPEVLDKFPPENLKPKFPEIAPDSPWFMGWLSKKNDLQSYLEGTLPRKSRPGGEGLILLAHHSEGDIWYAESDKLGLRNFTRSFPAGSVAILSACRMGNLRGNNAAIIEKLSEQGIEAGIFSPFKIDTFYGAAFATQFAKIVHQRMSAGQRGIAARAEVKTTLVDLFHMAVEAAGEEMTNPVSEMGLEFIIIGNHTLKLCED